MDTSPSFPLQSTPGDSLAHHNRESLLEGPISHRGASVSVLINETPPDKTDRSDCIVDRVIDDPDGIRNSHQVTPSGRTLKGCSRGLLPETSPKSCWLHTRQELQATSDEVATLVIGTAGDLQGRDAAQSVVTEHDRPSEGANSDAPISDILPVSILDPSSPVHTPAPSSSLPVRSGRVLFSDLTHSAAARARVLARESAVHRVLSCESAMGRESALRQVSAALRLSHTEGKSPISATVDTLRRWVRDYTRHGIDALVEQKKGIVGRRSVQIPAKIIAEARAAAVEYGTLGKDGSTNVARAYRKVIVSHPESTPEMRERLHAGHQSKSYVPSSIRRQLRVSPGARDLTQGSRAYHLQSVYTPGEYSSVKAGQILTGDDMTSNVYVWTDWPCALGYIVIRPQIIALLDCGSLSWLTTRVVMRDRGQYTSDDVWGVIGDAFDSYGLYPEFLFEGGIWRSNITTGHRTGLTNEERFGGLRQFGIRLRHSRHPRSKPIEGAFNQLQHAMDRLPGYAGRSEREDCPEATRRSLTLCTNGQDHPRHHFLHISQFSQHLAQVQRSLNDERQDGIVLRGLSPAQKWAADAPTFSIFPASAKWLYRSAKTVVTVPRSGQLAIRIGSGKSKLTYHYRNAHDLPPIAGQRVVVYWNMHHPDADCIVGIPRGAGGFDFHCTAQRVRPIDRYHATADALSAESRSKAIYRHAARAEVVSMAPYLQRTVRPTTTIPVDPSTAATSQRIAEAQEQAEQSARDQRSIDTAIRQTPISLDDIRSMITPSKSDEILD